MSLVLKYVQSKLARKQSLATIRGAIYAIPACHEGFNDKPLSHHANVARFLQGAKCKTFKPKHLFPALQLEVVLDAFCGPPFEPIETVELKFLTLKTAMLVAITSAQRVSELQALSIVEDEGCWRLLMGGKRLSLTTNPAFAPKTLRSSGRSVDLNAFHPPPHDCDREKWLNCLCLVRALMEYRERTRLVCKAWVTQLFVTFCQGDSGRPTTKPTISRWLVEAIQKA